MNNPLPMTLDECDGVARDVILVTGDAYVDHPAWGVAAIGRWLEDHGFSVGIIAQPDWEDPRAFEVLGRPNLFFGVTAGNMDSMVNHFTSARKPRRNDAYSPGGEAGLRPDRATIPYTARLRGLFKGTPVVIGGIEASLRRFGHYDFWQDRIRGSMLIDSKADLLAYGMAEHTVVEIARRLRDGKSIEDCRDIPGLCYALGAKGRLPEDFERVDLPDLDDCRNDPLQFNRATALVYRESNPHCGKVLVQKHGSRLVVQNPASHPLKTDELDRLHELPFSHGPHPLYRAPIPALTSMNGSIAVNRGCSGGCSFCALTIHQGKDVTSRSEDSVLREIKGMSKRKGWKGIISDLGGPTANMFHMRCTSPEAEKVCRRVSCLHPVRCKHYGTDHKPYMQLLRKARKLPGVRRVYVNSGIRYDLADLDARFVEELVEHHVPGQLSVAPEHVSDDVLRQMRKPGIQYFEKFMERFKQANEKLGKKQFVVPYFQCAHPGVGPKECIELAQYMKRTGLRPRQVQMFLPTPATLATAAYLSGKDPLTHEKVYVARGDKERSRQHALLFFWKQEQWPHVREALNSWGRSELIGRHPGCLVQPGPSYGKWARTSGRKRSSSERRAR